VSSREVWIFSEQHIQFWEYILNILHLLKVDIIAHSCAVKAEDLSIDRQMSWNKTSPKPLDKLSH